MLKQQRLTDVFSEKKNITSMDKNKQNKVNSNHQKGLGWQFPNGIP